jgi:hypothetical protein
MQLEPQDNLIGSAAPVLDREETLGSTTALPRLVTEECAPASFCSALNWLGKAHLDANRAEQAFGPYLIGEDIDPYLHLGSTTLFVIERTRTSACRRRPSER